MRSSQGQSVISHNYRTFGPSAGQHPPPLPSPPRLRGAHPGLPPSQWRSVLFLSCVYNLSWMPADAVGPVRQAHVNPIRISMADWDRGVDI